MSSYEWYFVRCQSGREDSIRKQLETRITVKGLQDIIPQILVPFERVGDLAGGDARHVGGHARIGGAGHVERSPGRLGRRAIPEAPTGHGADDRHDAGAAGQLEEGAAASGRSTRRSDGG